MPLNNSQEFTVTLKIILIFATLLNKITFESILN